MIRQRRPRQFSIRAMLILTALSAVGLVALRLCLVYGAKILACIVILTIPIMVSAIVLRTVLLGIAHIAGSCSAYLSNTHEDRRRLN